MDGELVEKKRSTALLSGNVEHGHHFVFKALGTVALGLGNEFGNGWWSEVRIDAGSYMRLLGHLKKANALILFGLCFYNICPIYIYIYMPFSAPKRDFH